MQAIEKWDRIQHAYQILSDPVEKDVYDRKLLEKASQVFTSKSKNSGIKGKNSGRTKETIREKEKRRRKRPDPLSGRRNK